LARHDPQDAVTVVGVWTSAGAAAPTPVGSRLPLGGDNVTTLVFRTGQAARTDYAAASGVIGDVATRDWGWRAAAGVPIRVEDRLWGLMVVTLTREELLPADTEARLAGFTELAATAIANAEAQAEVAASRARILTAADQTRRRIERDLHDGVQQRLVTQVLMPELLERQARQRTAHPALIRKIISVLGGRTPAPPAAGLPAPPPAGLPAAPPAGLPAPPAAARPEHLPEPLSQAEARVLRFLQTSLSAPEIAHELYVSVNTVRTYMRHLYVKLGAHRRLEAL
jgi:DNA-binding NarL/FixJ family response regulator